MTQTITMYDYQDHRIYTLVEDNSKTVNLPMNDKIIKVYKGADAYLSYRLKNQDRKPLSLAGANITMFLRKSGAVTQAPVISRPLTIINNYDATAEVLLQEVDIRDLEPGLYHMTLHHEDVNGIKRTMYSDFNQRAAVTVEIIDDQVPSFADSTTLDVFTDIAGNDVYYTAVSPGDAQSFDKKGLHTFAVYATNFTGKVYAEGTLDLAGNNTSKWWEAKLAVNNNYIQLTNFTGVEAYNFTGNVMWTRFRYEPDATNAGTIDKILYRS